jgi:hypothetical protein
MAKLVAQNPLALFTVADCLRWAKDQQIETLAQLGVELHKFLAH